MILENINNTKLFYNNVYANTNLNEYYLYILNILREKLKDSKRNLEINFGCELKKDINISFQYEHTIIKEHESYICKIHNYDFLKTMDYVFEYSNANINHIKKFEEYNEYYKKLVHIPPLIYNLSDSKKRNKDVITIHSSSPRRNFIHNQINMEYFHNIVGYNVFDKESIKKVLNDYKILVNIHQVDNHLTLEELRVLPALLTGILVISEEVPYKEFIPYNEHVIWCKYNELKEQILDVLKNYNYYKKKYFKNIKKTIEYMSINKSRQLDKIINS